MGLTKKAKILKIYIGEKADYQGHPLYRELVKVLKKTA